MLKWIDRWLNDNVPWSPGFCIAMAVAISLVILAGGDPATGLILIGFCLWLAFR